LILKKDFPISSNYKNDNFLPGLKKIFNWRRCSTSPGTLVYMRPPENLLLLIEKYRAGEATEEEKRILNEWYHSFEDGEVVIPGNEDLTEALLHSRLEQRLKHTIGAEKEPGKSRWKWKLPAAAAIILALAAGYFYMRSNSNPGTAKIETTKTNTINEINPGTDRALLTLADGSQIVLDSGSMGTIVSQHGISVEKLENGMVAYTIDASSVSKSDEPVYHSITTPRGGQYRITLSDGTKVWLNAASSIRFPTVFPGNERKVEVTGETYFEVARNPQAPFRVKAESSVVEVLGTHFNVNAYTDEDAIRTTLLEGKVMVTVDGGATLKYLEPGQQSGITRDGRIHIVQNADTEEAVAWINGRFQFKSAELTTILRQIARWYDVDVEYSGKTNMRFSGQLKRSESVSKVLEMLKLTGEVDFKIDNRKIVVTMN
jgi:ferric-dicitrate binding protein FerR (iron transport regulator)